MSEERDQIIGTALATLVLQQLDYALGRNPAAKPMLRLAAFEPREIAAACLALERSPGAEGFDVVVAAAPDSGIEQRFLLDTDRSLTWYRNQARRGVVLVEIDEVSDHAGISNFHRLTDTDILHGSRESLDESAAAEYRRARVAALADEAWHRTTGAGPCPSVMVTVLDELLAALFLSTGVSLRGWVDLVSDACASAARLGGPISLRDAQRAVGESLPALRLFPDGGLFDHGERMSRSS